MQSKFMFLNKWFDSDRPYFRLFMLFFVVALVAKGPVLFYGYAIDDYAFVSDTSSAMFGFLFSQGRYISAAIMWGFNMLGVGPHDMYFAFGLVTLFLQSAFVLSILRFVGVEASPAAGMVGAIIIAHPYLTEILTFRMALPAYSAALFFSIIALEAVRRSPEDWGARTLGLLGTCAMLATYQVFVNYYAVAIIFAFIYGQVLNNKNGQPSVINNIYCKRAATLTIISLISLILFVGTTRLAKALGLAGVTRRAEFITFDKIPERIESIVSSLVKIYWSAEPIFPRWLKILVAFMLVVSVAMFFWRLLVQKGAGSSLGRIVCTFFALLLLIPVSLGVIIPFEDFYPAPRVIAHVAIMVGLIFLMADLCMHGSTNRFLVIAFFTFRTLILVGFVLLSNQILADQQRINQWDSMAANRIISRLEMHPNFNDIRFVYISGGSYPFFSGLRTAYGDMNVSAFNAPWSNVALLSTVSGYKFESATGAKVTIGKTYCEGRMPWPHNESTFIDHDLAIICLKK